jgi:hypothetical protein
MLTTQLLLLMHYDCGFCQLGILLYHLDSSLSICHVLSALIAITNQATCTQGCHQCQHYGVTSLLFASQGKDGHQDIRGSGVVDITVTD